MRETQRSRSISSRPASTAAASAAEASDERRLASTSATVGRASAAARVNRLVCRPVEVGEPLAEQRPQGAREQEGSPRAERDVARREAARQLERKVRVAAGSGLDLP